MKKNFTKSDFVHHILKLHNRTFLQWSCAILHLLSDVGGCCYRPLGYLIRKTNRPNWKIEQKIRHGLSRLNQPSIKETNEAFYVINGMYRLFVRKNQVLKTWYLTYLINLKLGYCFIIKMWNRKIKLNLPILNSFFMSRIAMVDVWIFFISQSRLEVGTCTDSVVSSW